jgi:hypothetical protein
MRSRIIMVVLLTALFAAVFAIPKTSVHATSFLQAASTCKDTKLVGTVGTDLQTNFGAMKDIDKADSAKLVDLISAQRTLRQKYEDMDVPTEQACSDLLYYVVVTESSVSDLLVMLLEAKQNLVKDPTAFTADLDKQSKRFSKNLNDLAITVGLATPTP